MWQSLAGASIAGYTVTDRNPPISIGRSFDKPLLKRLLLSFGGDLRR